MAGRARLAVDLDEQVAQQVARPVALDVAVEVAAAWRTNARVDTGRLRGNVTVEEQSAQGTRTQVKVVDHAVDPASGYDYAAIQEGGSRDGRITPSRAGGRALAQVAREHGLRTTTSDL